MILSAAWSQRRGLNPPRAFTVDHGLREGSSEEAARVKMWARAHDVPHETLVWTARKPRANIQARAREERYRLIGEAMRARGVKILLTGHTLDDQAETFLLRLARGSGLDGLSGMSPIAPFPHPDFADLAIARPLLAFAHARLMATLRALEQPWIDDPSNANDRFARVQIRNVMASLEATGLTAERIADAAAHLRRARAAIDAAVQKLCDEAVELAPWGYAVLRPKPFADAPSEIALRALARLVQAIGGAEFPPRFEQIEALHEWLASEKTQPKGRTVGGCRIGRRPDGTVLLAREEAALAKEHPVTTLAPGATARWDRRIELTLTESPKPCEVRRLTPADLKLLGQGVELPPIEPNRIAATTPGVWRAGKLIAAPLLGISPANAAISARFVGFRKGPAR